MNVQTWKVCFIIDNCSSLMNLNIINFNTRIPYSIRMVFFLRKFIQNGLQTNSNIYIFRSDFVGRRKIEDEIIHFQYWTCKNTCPLSFWYNLIMHTIYHIVSATKNSVLILITAASYIALLVWETSSRY